jgi:hypothetical protein
VNDNDKKGSGVAGKCRQVVFVFFFSRIRIKDETVLKDFNRIPPTLSAVWLFHMKQLTRFGGLFFCYWLWNFRLTFSMKDTP